MNRKSIKCRVLLLVAEAAIVVGIYLVAALTIAIGIYLVVERLVK